MYKEIINEITTRLGEVKHIKTVINYPLAQDDRISAYPAAIVLPDTSNSVFSDNKANHRTLNFKMWVIVNGEQIDRQKLFTEVLPAAVDGVMEKFDADWNFGTNNGSRIWSRVSTGLWGLTVENKGAEAWAELNLVVRFDKTI